jgi:hypothetical protein
MSRAFLFVVVVTLALPAKATAQDQSNEAIIAEAVSALPDPLRAGAEVRAFRDGDLVKIREGGNGIICLGDNPGDERWHVACYHESLEPFMARGRELRAEGKERGEVQEIRRAEIESGSLSFPDKSVALYSLTGPAGSFDPATGEAEGANGLTVVYVPYATEATLGIPAQPSGARPWLMNSGEPWAHIMISR